MKRFFFAVLCALFTTNAVHAQLTGVKNIPGDYATFGDAITDLNTQGVGTGGVTINLLAGNPQTAPTGGYIITAEGTAANQIIFNGNGNTITAAALAADGSYGEGIIKIAGGDYITITQFVLQENPANTTVDPPGANNMTEWAIALMHGSVTNGAQHNTIIANTISLNKDYAGSFGIYCNVQQMATSPFTWEDITNNTTAPNSFNIIQGNTISNANLGIVCVGSGNSANMDQLNVIDGNTITNIGAVYLASIFPYVPGGSTGIFLNNQNNYTVSANTVIIPFSNTFNGMRGIMAQYYNLPTGPIVNTISGNSVTISQGGTGQCSGIYTMCVAGIASNVTVNIINNTILNCAISTTSILNVMDGISNAGEFGVLNITGNIFRDNTMTNLGGFNAIINTAAVPSAINITNNQLGGPAGGFIQIGAGSSGVLNGIVNQAATSTTTLTITGNNFEGITYAGSVTSNVTLINNTGPAISQNISSNTFTNLNLNTSGACTFISNNMTMPTGGSLVVNSNSIVTGFTKATSGSVTLYLSTTGTSPAGTTKSAQNNNFSNITLTSTSIFGWRDTEGAAAEGPTKTISNNIFSNWTCNSTITVLQTGNSGSNSIISGNTISNLSSSGAITAISFLATNRGSVQTISYNNISSLSSSFAAIFGITSASQNVSTLNITGNTLTSLSSTSGNFNVTGIIMTQGSTVNVSLNKVGDFQSANGIATGISITGGSAYNVFNNLVGDLRVQFTSAAMSVIGISVFGAANANLNSNTIYLNATSTGTNFGSAGISASTGTSLTLRNNLVINLSVANGSGLTVAYRRNAATISSYQTASNNNSFYAGTPSTTHFIFFDGSFAAQTLATYQSMVFPRDAASVTENPTFSSLVATSPVFLHIPAATATFLESGGVAISGFTRDYDNDVRPGPVGSVNGGGIAPDIGADEFDGLLICSGTPTAGTASGSPVAYCGPGTFTLSLAGQSTAVGISYQWQSSTTAGGPYTNLAGGTTVPFTTASISTTTYFVCVVTCNNSGLSATSNEVTGTINPPVSGSKVVTNVSCFGGSNGTINLTPSGGSGSYTFNWLPSGPTSEDRAGLAAGTYSVQITDNNGCTGTVTATVTQPTSPVSGTTVVTNIACFGGSNGIINLTPSGGTGPYTFNWLPSGPTTEDRTGLTAGTYSVQITDNNGCIATVTATVTQPTSPVSGTTVVTNVACFGGSNGAINLTPSGGTGPYTFNWLPSGPTTEDRTGLSVGTYSVQITDNNGCTGTVTATVTQPTSPVSGTTVVTNVSCFGGSNGTINLTPSGGTVPYTFNWLPSGPTTEDRTGLTAGTYSVQITDLNGCTGTVTATVTQPTSPVSGTTVVTNVSCFGGSNGTINLTPSGGTGPYTFNWLPSGPTTEDRTGLTAGTYSVQITDNNGCTGTVTATVTQPTSPVSGTTVVTNVSCFGGSNGTINLTPNGGTGPYTFNWLPSGPTTEDRTGLTAGTYSVQITDNNGCTGTVTATVTQPTSPVSGTTVVTNVSCFGGSNGTINLTPTGGSGSYTFNWLPSGPTTEDRTGLTAGTYTVIITDLNGCTGTVTATVTQPTSPVSGTTVVTNVSCFGGSNGTINLTPSGGTGPYTFNWLPSGPTTEDRTGLTAGTYSVQITDNNGCTGTVTATVTQPTSPVSGTTVVTNVSCFGGSNGAINLTPTGGTGPYTFNWLPSGPTTEDRTGLTAGTYTVIITDNNGCTGTVTATVTQPTSPVSGTTVVTNVSCFGGSNGTINLTPTGGTGPYTFNWLPSGPTTEDRTGLTAGTYSVQITDLNGCTATNAFTVTQPSAISVTASAQTNVSCFGGNTGAASINAATGGAGGFTYNWTPGNPAGDGTISVTGLTTGTWTVTTTDANGCTATNAFTVTQPSSALSSASSASPILCNGGSATVTVTASGGTFPYTGEGTFTEVAGNYSYTVTDANGCISTTSVTITEPTVLASTSTASSILCNGGNATVTVTASGGTSPYTGEGTFTEVAGNYSYTVTDNNGCTSSTSVTITEPTVLASTSTATAIICNGGNATVTVTASGGTSPYTGEGTFTEVAGNYSYTVTDNNGCLTTTSVTIPEPTVLASTSTATSILCNGGNATVTVTASGGTSPYTGEGTFTEVAGNYSYTVTDNNGCTSSTSVTITEPTVLASTSTASSILCNGGNATVTVTASGGTFPYTGEGTFTEVAGNYSYTVTDANGCSNSTSVTITEPDVLSVSVNATVNPTTCSGTDGSIDIDVIGGTTSYSFLWSNNDTNEDLTNIAAGSYNVTVTDANGCTAITSAFVNDPGAPIVTVSLPIDTACGGTSGTITLSGESPAGGIWSGSTVSGNTFDPSAAGVGNHYITYTFTDANGCSASAVDSIFVDLCSGIETGVTTAWSLFPNPTNGALNIITTADLSSDVVVEVYSADGKLLTSENKQHSKIITLDMTVQPVGVYFIRITANEKVSMYRVVKI